MWLASYLPLWTWAATWAFTALLCLIYAFAPPTPLGQRFKDWPAFTVGILVKVFWVLVILAGWASGAVERGWFSAIVWGGFALFVLVISGWRENNEH